MNHRLSDVDCTTFNCALVIAKNRNNDRESNGIGKTTLFSAIEFALFGEVPTSTLDKVVRDGCDKCFVTFDFQTVNGTYRIIRGRSSKGRSELKLYEKIGDEWESIAQRGIPETEKKIADLIKINHKAFNHSIKFSQSDVSGLSSATDAEKRKAILKEPLQLGDYTRLEKIASDKTRAIKKDVERLETTIQMLGDPSADIKAATSELSYCDSAITSKQTSIDTLTATIKEKQKALDSLKKSLGSSDSEVHEKINSLIKRSKELKNIIAKSNERVQESDRIINESQTDCAKLNKTISDLLEKQQELNSKSTRDAAVVAKEFDKVSADELLGTKLLAKFEAEYDQANKSVPSGNLCPHCMQPITDEHRKKCEEELSKILEERSEQIKSTKTNLQKCSNKKQRLQAELKELNDRNGLIQSISQKLEKANSEIDIRTKHIKEAEKRLAEASNEMSVAQAELDNVLINLSGLKDIAQNSSESDLNNKIFALNDDIKVYERSVQNVRNELSSAQNRKGAAEERLKLATDNLSNLEQSKLAINDAKYKLKIHQIVLNSFSPDGIPTFIIHTILNELQAEANSWLSRLRPELSLQFDKDVNMFFSVNNQLREYDQLSIGQKVYIALSLKLGLSRVIQKKLGIDIRFLLLDEVDAPLDKSGVDAFAEVVHKLQNEFKIFVVTHNDDLRHKFSHAILVEGDGQNGATSSVVTSW
jgi:DNA repair exonuclease SbcCD ATPase subunit